jgi:heptosyltransferase-2/heptosyltransferase-3
MERRDRAQVRPLVVRFGAMGDMVIVLTLIEALHRRFGTPVDLVSSGGWTRPLLGAQRGVGEILLVPSRRTPYAFSPDQRDLVERLRARGPAPTWLCDRGPKALQLLERAGYGREWVVDADAVCPKVPGEHDADRWLRFARTTPAAQRATPIDPPASLDDLRTPPLVVQPAWREDLDRWLRQHELQGRPLLLVQAGNKRTMRWWIPRRRATNTKYWPEERWAAVIDFLLQRDPDARVLLLGVPAEAALNDDVARHVGSDRVVNVANELPMQRLLALQERAQGMVSVDTGPAHSAAALGCPLVVLFADANVTRYTPRSAGSPVEVLVMRNAQEGLSGIRVDEVEQAWLRLGVEPGLAAGRGPRRDERTAADG